MLLIISPRPLHIAARSGMVRVVQELVRRGGNLSARDCDGETLLFHLTSRLASDVHAFIMSNLLCADIDGADFIKVVVEAGRYIWL